MNNKGFTLVEIILVLLIIGIITIITIPNIMEGLDSNKKESGKSMEELIEYNLKLYNLDNEEDIWKNDGAGCKVINGNNEGSNSIGELNTVNKFLEIFPDFDMGECLFKSQNSLVVKKIKDSSNNSSNDSSNNNSNKEYYEYYANIVCNKGLTDENGDKVLDDSDTQGTTGAYYETPNDDIPEC